jgi:Tfp pilus assembly protein FimV
MGDAMKGVRVVMPYDTYRLYQIERVKSPAEVRRTDEQAARLAAAASALFRGITRPVRAIGRPSPAAAWPAPPGLTGPGLCWQQKVVS